MLPLLSVLAVGAVVGVRVSVVGDLGEGTDGELIEELVVALKEEGHQAVVDRGKISCVEPASCVAAIREALGADEALLIEILAGASSIRIESARALAGEVEPNLHAEQILPRETPDLRGVARSLVRSLYPKSATAPPIAATATPIPVEKGWPIGPVLVFGASAGLTVTAIILGANSQAHFDRVETELLSSEDNRQLYDQAGTEATVATVLFSAAAAGIIGGVIWWVVD